MRDNGVKTVVTATTVMGCPHEEGEDFPSGGDCPLCPFWAGMQGSGTDDARWDRLKGVRTEKLGMHYRFWLPREMGETCSSVGNKLSTLRLRLTGKESDMEITPQNDEKLVVKHGGIPGSEFEDLNMSGTSFEDVSLREASLHQINLADARFDHVTLAGASFEDVNLSNISMHSVTMGGARFKHLSLHPDEHGNIPKQDPLEFVECDLNRSTFTDCDLSGIAIAGCDLERATIDGVPLAELTDAWEHATGKTFPQFE